MEKGSRATQPNEKQWQNVGKIDDFIIFVVFCFSSESSRKYPESIINRIGCIGILPQLMWIEFFSLRFHFSAAIAMRRFDVRLLIK